MAKWPKEGARDELSPLTLGNGETPGLGHKQILAQDAKGDDGDRGTSARLYIHTSFPSPLIHDDVILILCGLLCLIANQACLGGG